MGSKITAIRAQQRRHDRVSIYLDGEYAFGVQTVVAARLKVGTELSAEDIATLKRQDAGERQYEAALGFLAHRPRSRREMEQYLAKRQVPSDEAIEVLARLERAHLLDDSAFAASWVENRATFRPRSRWALRRELRAKGVDQTAIEAAVHDVDEEEGARQVALKYARRYAHLDEAVFRQRLLGVLQRRGYRYDVAGHAVTAAWHSIEPATVEGSDNNTERDAGIAPVPMR